MSYNDACKTHEYLQGWNEVSVNYKFYEEPCSTVCVAAFILLRESVDAAMIADKSKIKGKLIPQTSCAPSFSSAAERVVPYRNTTDRDDGARQGRQRHVMKSNKYCFEVICLH